MPKRKNSKNDKVSNKKRKSSPQGVYWHFTEYNMDWKPPVPYPEDTPSEEVVIRYLAYQLEVCPMTQRDHYQGYVQFYKKKYYKQCQTALGLSLETHCELEKKDPTVSINYVTKLDSRKNATDQPFLYGIPNLVGCKGGKPKTLSNWEESNAVYGEITKEAKTREQALEMIKEKAPRDLWCSFNNIKACSEYLYPDPVIKWVPEFLNYDWIEPPALTDWRLNEMPKGRRAKCLVVVGPSRWAKTEWARHIFPDSHMYFRNMFNLKKWDPNAKLIIFDDIEWEFIPSKKTLLTQMGEGELTDRYMKKQTCHVTMPAIVLLNEYPDFGKETKYWADNTVVVELTCPLGLTPYVLDNYVCFDGLYKRILNKGYYLPTHVGKEKIREEFIKYNNDTLPKAPQSDSSEDSEIEEIVRQTEILQKEREEADKLLSERQIQCLEYNNSEKI